MAELTRREYAALYGATTGDQVRLGDTDLWVEVEQDLTFGGEEAVFGGGKSIRESMAQGTTTRADGAPDTVITNVVVLDHWGVVKADVGPAGRPDRRARPRRQPRHRRRGPPGPGHRPLDRRHLGRGPDPHGRGDRRARALPVHVPGARGAGHRHHHGRRGRHGPVRGIPGHDGHARGLAPAGGAPGPRPPAGQRPADGQGQHRERGGAGRAGAGRRRGVQGPRGLGLHAGGHRRRAAGRRRARAPGGAALGLAQRGGLPRVDRGGDRRPLDPRLPHRGRRRRARAGHHRGGLAPPRHPGLDQPDAAAHGQHRRRAPRHADGLPPPQPAGARGPGVRGVPDPGDDDRRRGRPARPGRPLDHLVGRPGDGPDRRGRLPHLAGRARHEGPPRLPRRLAARRQRARAAVRRQVHDQPGDRARDRPRGRLGRGRQAGGPGALGPAVLRHPAGARDQGRRDRPGRARATRTPRSRPRSRC